MNTVKIADLKNNLSRHLAQVRRGREITVFDRDTPVARLVPFVHGDTAARRAPGQAATGAADRIAGLVRQGVLSPGDPQAVAGWMDTHPPIRLPPGSPGGVDVLLGMRRESRR